MDIGDDDTDDLPTVQEGVTFPLIAICLSDLYKFFLSMDTSLLLVKTDCLVKSSPLLHGVYGIICLTFSRIRSPGSELPTA
jgi:hypothetical protein